MKSKKQRNKSISEIIAEQEKRIERQDTCEYCGRRLKIEMAQVVYVIDVI